MAMLNNQRVTRTSMDTELLELELQHRSSTSSFPYAVLPNFKWHQGET
jgi:hypothetical protein